MYKVKDRKILLLRPEEIFPSPDRMRKTVDEYALRSLAESISAVGVTEPLCVRPDGKNRYILIYGERRLKAAKMIGLRRLPCIIHNADQQEAAVLTLTHHLGRYDLDFFEQAQAIDSLLGIYGIPAAELAARLGMAKPVMQNKLDLLKTDPLERERILAEGLTEAHVRALLRLAKKDFPLVLDTVIDKNLSAKQTEQLVSAILSPMSENYTPQPQRKSAVGNAKLFSNSLSKLVLTMQNAGVQMTSVKRETEDYIEYEVRIEKNTVHQLRLAGV